MDALSSTNRWILAGSICGWGDVAVPLIDLAVFVVALVDVRLTRLEMREQDIFGSGLAQAATARAVQDILRVGGSIRRGFSGRAQPAPA
jgi:cytidylate kinase